MKLHEALRKILKQFGTSVMQDGKRLMSMMADFHAFEDYPAMKQVMGAVFTGRYGKELFTRAADDESGDYELYIGYLRQSLVQILHFREEFSLVTTAMTPAARIKAALQSLPQKALCVRRVMRHLHLRRSLNLHQHLFRRECPSLRARASAQSLIALTGFIARAKSITTAAA